MTDNTPAQFVKPQPLLGPTSPKPEESLLGLLARAVAENHVVSIRKVLSLNGLPTRAGAVVQADAAAAQALAMIVGCDADDIKSRLLIRTVNLTEKHSKRGRVMFDWGGCQLPLYKLEKKYRRFGPIALTVEKFHRSSWLLRSLPYCPFSYEFLVDQCNHCGIKQGWRSSRGIANCDICGKRIDASQEPLLPTTIRKGYDLIAGLSSFDDAIAADTIQQLSPKLHHEKASDLVQTALVLGRFLVTGAHHLSARDAAQNEKLLWASCLARGAEALLDWPTSFKASLSENLIRLSAELGGIARLTGRLTNKQEAGIGTAMIIRRDMPELCNSKRKSPAALVAPIMPIGEFLRRTKFNGRHFKRLKDGLAFEGLETTGTSRKTIEIHREMGEAIIEAKTRSTPIESVAYRFGFPVYAIEQLIADGLLTTRHHPIFDDLELSCRIDNDSITSLFDRLEEQAKATIPRASRCSHSLGKMLQRFGGEKPWGTLFRLLLDGTIAYKTTMLPFDRMKARLATSIIVKIKQFNEVTPTLIAPSNGSEWLSDVYSQADVMEVLGLNHSRIKIAEAAGVLTSHAVRRNAKLYGRAQVLLIARDHAGISETAYRLGEPFAAGIQLSNLCSRVGLRERTCGWLRTELPELASGFGR